ncbi:MAG TPA: photosynthetic reaction center cytochrome c subunit family protein [Rhodothermales bacterium]|nr:photosynthetic reaction center cytochrome c subunit family protein [Rhodothermales bacterium]
MRRRSLLLPALVLAGLALLPLTFAAQLSSRSPSVSVAADSISDARQRHVQAVLARIAGREQQPAREVFQNVRLLGDVPAGRLVRIMDMGYGRSLGVSCEHCHDPASWTSDEKQAKTAARGMIEMVGRINRELLPTVEGLRGQRPTVNCTTCHRGQVTPALNLPER